MGSRDAWTFIHPSGGIFMSSNGSIFPYATTMMIDGDNLLIASINCSSLNFSGWRTSIPASLAMSFTGGGFGLLLLPAALSGCVTTDSNSIKGALINVFNEGTENSGVPKKIALSFSFLKPSCIFSETASSL